METKPMKLKTIALALPLFMLASLAISSCDNSAEEGINLITEEDAVEVLESTFVNGAEGIVDEIEDAALIAGKYEEERNNPDVCGVPFDSTLVKDVNRPKITASYSTTLAWTLNCNDFLIPSTLLFGRTATGNYETDRFSGNSQSASEWTIDDLILGPNWVFNGNFDRSGGHQSMVRNQQSLDLVLNTVFSDLKVDKNDLVITSGEGTLTLLLSDNNGNSKTFEGSITFNGDGIVTVTINGNTYEIDLN